MAGHKHINTEQPFPGVLMPRRTTQFIRGHHYHLYNRGALRGLLFHEPENYQLFLHLLDTYATQCECTILSVCLMPNHFHVLIRQDGDTAAGKVIGLTCLVFGRKMNYRYRRFGTLLQGRYQSKLVHDESYLRHLCRYIHANPVVAGLAKTPDDWPYSNFSEWMGNRDTLPYCKEFVETYFPNTVDYREFVSQQIWQNKLTNEDLARDLAKARLI